MVRCGPAQDDPHLLLEFEQVVLTPALCLVTTPCAASHLQFHSHSPHGVNPIQTGSHKQVLVRWVLGAHTWRVLKLKRHQPAPPDRVFWEEQSHSGRPGHPLLEQRPTVLAPQHAASCTPANRQPPATSLRGCLQNTSIPGSALSRCFMASSISCGTTSSSGCQTLPVAPAPLGPGANAKQWKPFREQEAASAG